MDIFVKYMNFNMCSEFSNEIDDFPKINSECDSGGNFLIHYAALCKNPWFLQRLLDSNVNTLLLTNDGSSFVHFIAHEIDFSIIPINYLDIKNNLGRTPLHYAIVRDNIKMVKYLIDKVNINTRLKENGYTYLHFAISRKKYDIAVFLLGYLKLSDRDKQGNTTAMIGVRYNFEIFNPIFNYPGLYAETNNEGNNIFHFLMRYRDEIQWKNLNKLYPGLINVIDLKGRSVLHYAVRFMKAKDFEDLAKAVNPEIIGLKDNDGWNIATEAAVNANCHLLKVISSLGVRVLKIEDLTSIRDYNPGVVELALA